MIIRPQPGPQEMFLSSSADIAIAGGAAGFGKTFGLLLMPIRHIKNPNFGCVTFRRETPQLTAEGGIWDTSLKIYPKLKARPKQNPSLQWTFPSGAKHTMSHLQLERTVSNWDSAQIALLQYDELQQFFGSQFFYMLSRNRSLCGVTPYVRAGCNPDPDSFLRDFLSWWIDQETGYPIYERSGKIRFMVRIDNTIYWADSKKELTKKYGSNVSPKSVTFIPGNVTDNQILMSLDPGYIANLKALPEYEKLRLLGGNWFARPSAGDLFKRHYFHIIEKEEIPEQELFIRYWDRAATVPSDTYPDPDWTAGVLMSCDNKGNYYIWDVRRDREAPAGVEQMVITTGGVDSKAITIGLEQEPGASGVMEVDYFIRLLAGYSTEAFPKTKNKLTCWKPLSAQAKNGNVYLVRGRWNEPFMNELEGVTDGTQKGHDDQADAAAGAFNYLSEKMGKYRGPIIHKKHERLTSGYRKRQF